MKPEMIFCMQHMKLSSCFLSNKTKLNFLWSSQT